MPLLQMQPSNLPSAPGQAEAPVVLYVNGARRLLPGDRANQTLLSYLRGETI